MTVSPVVSGQIFEIEVLDVEEWHWTVLDVDILVNDYEIGVGSNLVHPVQKIPLVALCQAQITHSQNVLAHVNLKSCMPFRISRTSTTFCMSFA